MDSIATNVGVLDKSVAILAALAERGPLSLAGLVDATGESAQLYLRRADERICVAAAERASGLRDTVPIGAVLPIDRGSGGKVLLAFGGDSDGAAARFPGIDRAELETIRRRGWAASVAEREEGVCSVSAPVLDSGGRVHAALGVSGPINRLGRQPGRHVAAPVVAAARELERRAGLAARA